MLDFMKESAFPMQTGPFHTSHQDSYLNLLVTMIEPVLRLSASIIKGLVKIMNRIETIHKTARLRPHPIAFQDFGAISGVPK
jgi:hypothetical protein